MMEPGLIGGLLGTSGGPGPHNAPAPYAFGPIGRSDKTSMRADEVLTITTAGSRARGLAVCPRSYLPRGSASSSHTSTPANELRDDPRRDGDRVAGEFPAGRDCGRGFLFAIRYLTDVAISDSLLRMICARARAGSSLAYTASRGASPDRRTRRRRL
jgi:hypothetical protein